MTAGQKQIWAPHYKGDAAAQKDRNRSFELACHTGPDKIKFEGKSDQQIKTQYNDLLRRKRGNDSQEGPSASGSSQSAIDDEYQAFVSVFYFFDSFFLNLASPVLSFVVSFATQR